MSGSPRSRIDQVGAAGDRVVQAGHAGRGGTYGVTPLAERVDQRPADLRIVLDQQQQSHGDNGTAGAAVGRTPMEQFNGGLSDGRARVVR